MGTKLEIWKQGQFYPELGKKIIELPYQVNPGPSDQQVKIEGFNVQPDRDGNFLHGNYAEDELDAIHTYGIVRMVIDLYERILKQPIVWSWQQKGIQKPLNVRIRNNDINSRYLKEYQTIELDYYGPYNNWVYNCRTVDLVAHETGHAIIDSLKPEWEKGDAETRGMAEAFCDLSAMFLILSQQDLCEEVIRETKDDLSQSSILSLFGVGHGHKENEMNEIRNVLNEISYEKKEWYPYFYAEVLNVILYSMLQEQFSTYRYAVGANKLYQIGDIWMKDIVSSFLKCRRKRSSVEEFALNYLEFSSLRSEIIIKHFRKRNVF